MVRTIKIHSIHATTSNVEIIASVQPSQSLKPNCKSSTDKYFWQILRSKASNSLEITGIRAMGLYYSVVLNIIQIPSLSLITDTIVPTPKLLGNMVQQAQLVKKYKLWSQSCMEI